MNWDAIAAVSPVIAAAGVIASLVYLAAQIRNNSQEIRAASFNAVTDSFNQFNFLIAQNEPLAEIFLRGTSDYGQLDGVQEVRFDLMILGLFRIHESVYCQSIRGTLESDLRDAENRSVIALIEMPGIRAWWRDNPYSFTTEFRTHIEGLMRQIEAGSRELLFN